MSTENPCFGCGAKCVKTFFPDCIGVSSVSEISGDWISVRAHFLEDSKSIKEKELWCKD